jgi:A/G-specific adenine glycosylase
MAANAGHRLLQHYVDNFRRLPWRAAPGEPPQDPYRVWLSEVMLQQTTVAAVSPRFERFVTRWPTVKALAAAPDEDILSEWAGLGYYARARNLIACAREIANRGEFPNDEASLRRLPGIGEYTAAAIAAIAFGRDAAPVDGNVERVIARVHGLAAPARTDVRERFAQMAPSGRCGDFVQAMMDLGATICRPRSPLCSGCPLSSDCIAFASGLPEDFPARRSKKQRPVRFGVAHWIERSDAIWLVRREAKGLLGGMPSLPGDEWTATSQAGGALALVTHVFTHFELRLSIVPAAQPEGEGWWQPLDGLEAAGLPTLYRKAANAVLAGRQKLAA